VESIPLNVNLKTQKTTFDSWKEIIVSAKSYLYFAEYYWNLLDGKNYLDAGGAMGFEIFNLIVDAHHRGVKILIVSQKPTDRMKNDDAIYFRDKGIAQVKFIDWELILKNGILHTKMIIADNITFYIGSANTDWESLIQVKEMGIYVKNNPSLVEDAKKIFFSYWLAASTQTLPSPWPSDLYAIYNKSYPQPIMKNNYVYLSASPSQFVVPHRTGDLESLMDAIKLAQKNISIEVMDYFPGTIYLKENYYWPDIDNALRDAAFRGIKVRFLVSKWNYSNPRMFQYLKSLNQIQNIQVKQFEIEEWKPPIPYTRVNHAKYVVTENKAFISTSNWSGDYFLWTGGVTINWVGDFIVSDLQKSFDRDWDSPYAKTITCSESDYLL